MDTFVHKQEWSVCLKMHVWIYNWCYPEGFSITNLICFPFLLLQVPSAPPTYTGRQLWWTRGLDRGCVVENEEDGEGEEGRVQDEGPVWLEWTYNMGANSRALSPCVQTWDFKSDCVPINYCMSVCVRLWERRVWRTELKSPEGLLAHKSL